MLFVGSAMAQNEKNIFGVRAGMNLAWMGESDATPGFRVAGTFEHRFVNSLPLYLETGLEFSQKGGEGAGIQANAWYLQIPVMVNYKFNIANKVTLYPSAGLFLGVGLGGSTKFADGDWHDFSGNKIDTFGNLAKRCEVGMRLAGTAVWKQFTFGLGFEFGFNNINKYGDWDEDFRSGNFFLQVGYNF